VPFTVISRSVRSLPVARLSRFVGLLSSVGCRSLVSSARLVVGCSLLVCRLPLSLACWSVVVRRLVAGFVIAGSLAGFVVIAVGLRVVVVIVGCSSARRRFAVAHISLFVGSLSFSVVGLLGLPVMSQYCCFSRSLLVCLLFSFVVCSFAGLSFHWFAVSSVGSGRLVVCFGLSVCLLSFGCSVSRLARFARLLGLPSASCCFVCVIVGRQFARSARRLVVIVSVRLPAAGFASPSLLSHCSAGCRLLAGWLSLGWLSARQSARAWFVVVVASSSLPACRFVRHWLFRFARLFVARCHCRLVVGLPVIVCSFACRSLLVCFAGFRLVIAVLVVCHWFVVVGCCLFCCSAGRFGCSVSFSPFARWLVAGVCRQFACCRLLARSLARLFGCPSARLVWLPVVIVCSSLLCSSSLLPVCLVGCCWLLVARCRLSLPASSAGSARFRCHCFAVAVIGSLLLARYRRFVVSLARLSVICRRHCSPFSLASLSVAVSLSLPVCCLLLVLPFAVCRSFRLLFVVCCLSSSSLPAVVSLLLRLLQAVGLLSLVCSLSSSLAGLSVGFVVRFVGYCRLAECSLFGRLTCQSPPLLGFGRCSLVVFVCSVISSGLSVSSFAAVRLLAGLVCWFGCSVVRWLLARLVARLLVTVVCCLLSLFAHHCHSVFIVHCSVVSSVGSLLRLFVCFVGFVVITGWFGCLLAGCSLPLSPAHWLLFHCFLFVARFGSFAFGCSLLVMPRCLLASFARRLVARSSVAGCCCRFVARLVAARLPLSSTRINLPDGIQARLEGITHIPQIIITSF
jgi:hypothetical protein